MDEVMLHGGLLVAKMLKREGVEVVFTLSGGHIAAIYDGCVREGIRVMDTRHEQVAVHAAEGWAKVTRTPGVALLTAGPGVTDGVTGIANAYLAGSPVLIFGGAAPVAHWDQGALQELRHVDLVRPITKWARTVVQTQPARRVYRDGLPRGDQPGAPAPSSSNARWTCSTTSSPADRGHACPAPGYRTDGQPAGRSRRSSSGRRALLAKAERPVIFAGTTVWWDDAAGAAARAGRAAAGARLPQWQRAWQPAARPSALLLAGPPQAALGNADLMLLVGTKLDFRLNYGQPPLIPADAKIVWLDTLAERYRRQSWRGCRACAGDVGAMHGAAGAQALGKRRQITRSPGWRRCATRRRRRARPRRR